MIERGSRSGPGEGDADRGKDEAADADRETERVGDEVRFTTPRGTENLEVLEVSYPAPERSP
jgi:hypothetical protein